MEFPSGINRRDARPQVAVVKGITARFVEDIGDLFVEV
jgi:hypothetical protein